MLVSLLLLVVRWDAIQEGLERLAPELGTLQAVSSALESELGLADARVRLDPSDSARWLAIELPCADPPGPEAASLARQAAGVTVRAHPRVLEFDGIHVFLVRTERVFGRRVSRRERHSFTPGELLASSSATR